MITYSENPLPFIRFVKQKTTKTHKIYSMWIRNIQTMTSAMHVNKVDALFRNLFVESRFFDLLFKPLVTTIVRNESIPCSSSLILETLGYLFTFAGSVESPLPHDRYTNDKNRSWCYETCTVNELEFVFDVMIYRKTGLIFFSTHIFR